MSNIAPFAPDDASPEPRGDVQLLFDCAGWQVVHHLVKVPGGTANTEPVTEMEAEIRARYAVASTPPVETEQTDDGQISWQW